MRILVASLALLAALSFPRPSDAGSRREFLLGVGQATMALGLAPFDLFAAPVPPATRPPAKPEATAEFFTENATAMLAALTDTFRAENATGKSLRGDGYKLVRVIAERAIVTVANSVVDISQSVAVDGTVTTHVREVALTDRFEVRYDVTRAPGQSEVAVRSEQQLPRLRRRQRQNMPTPAVVKRLFAHQARRQTALVRTRTGSR